MAIDRIRGVGRGRRWHGVEDLWFLLDLLFGRVGLDWSAKLCPEADVLFLELPVLAGQQNDLALEAIVLGLDDRLLFLETLDFLSLPLPGRVSGQPVADDTLDPSLFLLSVGLSPFPAVR